ncbi:MAG: glucose-6-phosphate isomerase [Actinomycetota bacterium]
MTVAVEIAAGDVGPAIEKRLTEWGEANFAERLWDRDPTLWFDPPRDEIDNRLGWLCPGSAGGIAGLEVFAEAVSADGFSDVVLLGMGGSSLAPEVFASVFRDTDAPRLTVLDSTHPGAVARVADAIDPDTSLFIVASKSGTTLETMSFFRFFWDRVSSAVDDPGDHFIAITDPGSQLAQLGDDRGFRAVFHAPADVGGRFSALIEFGLVPASLVGIDLKRLLEGADAAAWACGPEVPVNENPALRLGAALGEFALAGRDKIVFATDPLFSSFPAWIEQLIAESLGKDGKGILPVADGHAEPAPDRLPFFIGLSGADQPAEPSVALTLDDAYDLGGAMFILEMATAAAGVVLGVHPFDQPDVQLAKSFAHKAMSEGFGGLEIVEWTFTDEGTSDHVTDLLSSAGPGGYVAIQAYLQPSSVTVQRLDAIAETIAEKTGAVVTIGLGPRFLHSTGQFHKGGPDGGVFLQIVDHPAAEVDVPETDYTFGKLIAAQSFGDQAALQDRGRPIGMVCLGDAGPADLPRLREMIESSGK